MAGTLHERFKKHMAEKGYARFEPGPEVEFILSELAKIEQPMITIGAKVANFTSDPNSADPPSRASMRFENAPHRPEILGSELEELGHKLGEMSPHYQHYNLTYAEAVRVGSGLLELLERRKVDQPRVEPTEGGMSSLVFHSSQRLGEWMSILRRGGPLAIGAEDQFRLADALAELLTFRAVHGQQQWDHCISCKCHAPAFSDHEENGPYCAVCAVRTMGEQHRAFARSKNAELREAGVQQSALQRDLNSTRSVRDEITANRNDMARQLNEAEALVDAKQVALVAATKEANSRAAQVAGLQSEVAGLKRSGDALLEQRNRAETDLAHLRTKLRSMLEGAP
jgi:hypothetical protein